MHDPIGEGDSGMEGGVGGGARVLGGLEDLEIGMVIPVEELQVELDCTVPLEDLPDMTEGRGSLIAGLFPLLFSSITHVLILSLLFLLHLLLVNSIIRGEGGEVMKDLTTELLRGRGLNIKSNLVSDSGTIGNVLIEDGGEHVSARFGLT